MYGVVLMMALSGGGADLPAMNDAAGEHVARYGDHGQKQYRCGGRLRGRCGGCYGGSYGGCCGGRGYGCYGGGYGCSGGGYGCYGGGYGCSGGGYRYGGYGYGAMPYAGGYYGYAPDSGATYYSYSPYGAPVYSGGTPAGYGYGMPANQGYYGSEAPATIMVRLPADARLTIDGASTSSTQEMRTFISPPLQPGKEYQYTLRAEVMRDGKKVERTRDVTVRAGQQSEVTIDLPAQGGPSKD
jgi:uncharacterized protein (TIGR03000 family)